MYTTCTLPWQPDTCTCTSVVAYGSYTQYDVTCTNRVPLNTLEVEIEHPPTHLELRAWDDFQADIFYAYLSIW